jgi:hypothetical protein
MLRGESLTRVLTTASHDALAGIFTTIRTPEVSSAPGEPAMFVIDGPQGALLGQPLTRVVFRALPGSTMLHQPLDRSNFWPVVHAEELHLLAARIEASRDASSSPNTF